MKMGQPEIKAQTGEEPGQTTIMITLTNDGVIRKVTDIKGNDMKWGPDPEDPEALPLCLIDKVLAGVNPENDGRCCTRVVGGIMICLERYCIKKN